MTENHSKKAADFITLQSALMQTEMPVMSLGNTILWQCHCIYGLLLTKHHYMANDCTVYEIS